MKYLLLSVLAVCMVGVMVISNVFAETNNSQEDIDLYFHKGQAFLNHGYWIQGLENLENALTLATPETSITFSGGITDYEQAQNYYDANKDYRERSISISGYFQTGHSSNPDSDEIKDGFIHLLDQEPEKALSKCSNALKNDSESMYAWICTQGALVKLERYAQVAKNYENYPHLSSKYYPEDQVTIFGRPSLMAPANVIAY